MFDQGAAPKAVRARFRRLRPQGTPAHVIGATEATQLQRVPFRAVRNGAVARNWTDEDSFIYRGSQRSRSATLKRGFEFPILVTF